MFIPFVLLALSHVTMCVLTKTKTQTSLHRNFHSRRDCRTQIVPCALRATDRQQNHVHAVSDRTTARRAAHCLPAANGRLFVDASATAGHDVLSADTARRRTTGRRNAGGTAE